MTAGARARAEVGVEELDRALLGGVHGEAGRTRVDLGIVPVFREERPLLGLAGLLDWRGSGRLSRLLRSGFYRAAAGEQVLIPCDERMPMARLVLVGLGPKESFDAEAARAASERFVDLAQGLRALTVLLALPEESIERDLSELMFEALLERLERRDSEGPTSSDGETSLEQPNVPAESPTDRAEPEAGEAHSGEAEAHSGEAEAHSGEAEAHSGEAEAHSGEAEAQSDEAEAQSDEAEAQSDEAEAQSDEAEAQSDEAEAHSGEAKAHSDEAKAQSGEAGAQTGEGAVAREAAGEDLPSGSVVSAAGAAPRQDAPVSQERERGVTARWWVAAPPSLVARLRRIIAGPPRAALYT